MHGAVQAVPAARPLHAPLRKQNSGRRQGPQDHRPAAAAASSAVERCAKAAPRAVTCLAFVQLTYAALKQPTNKNKITTKSKIKSIFLITAYLFLTLSTYSEPQSAI